MQILKTSGHSDCRYIFIFIYQKYDIFRPLWAPHVRIVLSASIAARLATSG
jgi:hypothetical protein